ncbi:hypothetical protein ZWY2020_031778 [Hordeum vulgare]|nr:hypothetical protein ZWY2020_031778 [Hordeum vulgare]
MSSGSTTGYRNPRAPCDEGRPVRHVRAEVRDHLGLVLGGHAHERRQEDDDVSAELGGEVRDVGRVERHAGAHARVPAEQPAGALVCGAAQVVVVEHLHCVRQVARGEDVGAEGERAGADEGDAGRGDAAGHVRSAPAARTRAC